MNKTIDVRFFMFLSDLCKERKWDNPLQLDIGEAISGTALLEKLHVPLERVEVLMVNGKAVSPLLADIHAGDRVAVLPPGTPGPYRMMLGFRKME